MLSWFDLEKPDVVCLQEIKASPEQVPASLIRDGYWAMWHGHKGYSGVALLLSKERFPEPPVFSHPSFDHENRVVVADVAGMRFASIYLPNGGKDFEAKLRFMDALEAYAQQLGQSGQRAILCGDLNVARETRDVHPRLQDPNQIGQTPGERAQLERTLGHGLTDLGRKFEPDNEGLFTWWAPWRNMRQRNMGWRLDYVLATSPLADAARSCKVHADFGTSDHAPVAAHFELPGM